MISLEEVIKYNISVPYPRWIKGMDRKSCFVTNTGWDLLRADGKIEKLMMIRNLDKKVEEYINSHSINIQKTDLDKEFEKQFTSKLQNNITKNNTQEKKNIKEIINKETETKPDYSKVKFDFIELESEIEQKLLRKNNLIRIYLTWTDSVLIRSFDKKRTYIEVFDNKNHKLGNAEYRNRETEKTLMFVYKIGKEKLDHIRVSSKLYDGTVKDKNNLLILNENKIYDFDVNVNL